MLNIAVFATAANALADVHYVDVNSTNATPPYTNWTTAATNIQDAVDAAVAGDEIVVTNGIYATGGRSNYFGSTRVAIDKPLELRSVNGPQYTTIAGASDGYGIKCVALASNATLSGFTLTNGVSWHVAGGIGCESVTAVVSNCVISGNLGSDFGDGGPVYGGGAYGGTLNNCTLTGNSALADDRAFGGGAYGCTLNNCTLANNEVAAIYSSYGGGAESCTLNNCVVTGNSASSSIRFSSYYAYGGGADLCTLTNCTVAGNSVIGGWGGGASASLLYNCIVSFNTGGGLYGSRAGSSFFDDPLFLDTNGWANLRLQPNSPCIDAGANARSPAGTDLDGNPRISGGVVDIGAYEFQLPQLTITPSSANLVLSWPTNNAGYDYTGFTLQSTTNLGSPAVWSTNSHAPVVMAGQNTVTNPIAGAQKLYRLIH
jgi:hypothetical protein